MFKQFVPMAMNGIFRFGRFARPHYIRELISPRFSSIPVNATQFRELKTDVYDVFVSFRGKDIRGGFLGHLVEAFDRKKINAFVDDKLKRGHEIPPSLIEGIKGSLISLVIFSQDYASSHWCLEELVTILQCREKYGQIVIPVFYQVDPRNVRHQRGSYENAFAEHEKRYDSTKVTMWRHALYESANLSGIKSLDFGNDAQMLKEIIKSVFMYLNNNQQVNSKGLVGIHEPITRINSLLRPESKDVRVIGIWGMGGVGKTTIAEEVFHQKCSEFEGYCFLRNVREQSARHGTFYLKEKLFSALLEEYADVNNASGLPGYVKTRIGRMKVLIVLDDVNDLHQLEILIGDHDWFGQGSRIIITTRDKQVLSKDVDDIYEVGPLNFEKSFTLFISNAFKQKQIDFEYYDISNRVVNYAKGIPLVLKVLGHLLHGKDKEIWESLLWKFKKMPSKEVFDVMRLSYDDLDRKEQTTFLDLACFFYGWTTSFFYGWTTNMDAIRMLLKDGENDISIVDEIERLKDKALISFSKDNGLSMHDIIQEMAMEIVRQESIEDPGKRSRLWDPDEIYEVLKNNKGSEAIRTIRMGLSNIKKLELHPSIFAKMSNLQFLSFDSEYDLNDSDYLPEGLQSMPPKLRYLNWKDFPFKSLPKQFSMERLVMLRLPNNRMEKLWDGVQNLMNLKVVILSAMKLLKQLPDFSKATNLEVLSIGYCYSLTEFSTDIHLSSLKYLDLEQCTNLKNFSVTLERMIEANLQSTPIKLEFLRLVGCCIESLPSCIKNLTRLLSLEVGYCLKLQILPVLPLTVEILLAQECKSLKTVLFPSIAEQFKENRKRVVFWNCLKLDEHSLKSIAMNAQINVMKLAYQQLSSPERNEDERYSKYGHIPYQIVYTYPGSSVPEWFVYTKIEDYIFVDLTSAPCSPVSGFIFCFVLGMTKYLEGGLHFYMTICDGDGEDEIEYSGIFVPGSFDKSESDHVLVIHDPRCSRNIYGRVKYWTKLKIKVELFDSSRDFPKLEFPAVLKGFGVNPINASAYHNFIQKLGLND